MSELFYGHKKETEDLLLTSSVCFFLLGHVLLFFLWSSRCVLGTICLQICIQLYSMLTDMCTVIQYAYRYVWSDVVCLQICVQLYSMPTVMPTTRKLNLFCFLPQTG